MSTPQRHPTANSGVALLYREIILDAELLHRLAIAAVVTIFGGERGRAVERFLYFTQGRLHPLITSLVRNNGDVKFEFSIKRLLVFFAVCVDKISGIGNNKSVMAQEPLINLHLSLVSLMP